MSVGGSLDASIIDLNSWSMVLSEAESEGTLRWRRLRFLFLLNIVINLNDVRRVHTPSRCAPTEMDLLSLTYFAEKCNRKREIHRTLANFTLVAAYITNGHFFCVMPVFFVGSPLALSLSLSGKFSLAVGYFLLVAGSIESSHRLLCRRGSRSASSSSSSGVGGPSFRDWIDTRKRRGERERESERAGWFSSFSFVSFALARNSSTWTKPRHRSISLLAAKEKQVNPIKAGRQTEDDDDEPVVPSIRFRRTFTRSRETRRL